MSRVGTLARWMGSQWLAAAYVGAVSMLLAFFLARHLGPAGFGVYSFVLSIASLFMILQDAGYRTIIFRESTLGSERLRRFLPQLLALALGNTLLFTLLGVLLVNILPLGEKAALAAAVLCFGLVAVAGFVSAALKGQGRFELEALWQSLVRTLTALFIPAAVLWVGAEPWGVFAAWSAGVLLALCFQPFRGLLKRPRLAVPGREIWQACLAFVIIDAATALYFRIDIVLLKGLLSDDAEVGNYAAAYRLLEGVIFLATPLAHVCFRHLRLRWEDRERFAALLVRMLWIMLLLAGTMIGGAVLAGEEIVRLAYGPDYLLARALLPWLFLALAFILPGYILTQAAIALNRQAFYAGCAVLAAGFNIGLNLWLIPRHGAFGAAWATIATEGLLVFALAGAMLQWLRKKA